MILIASNSGDEIILRPVIAALKAQGEDVLVYEADAVASGKVRAGMVVDRNARTTFFYDGREFSAADVEAAWYKRANYFSDVELTEAHLIFLDNQRRACQDSLWYSIPSDRWLNAPRVIDSIYEDKIVQAHFAHEVGFEIPRTVITNDWDMAFHSFGTTKVAVKLPNGRMYIDQKLHHMLTTVVDHAQYEKLRETSPFPGIWQEFIPKKREWRVTVVGDEVFPAAIYTTKQAKTDWRKLQFYDEFVQFKAEKLPKVVSEKCVALLQKMGVGYGAFDLIERADGSFVFLEVNLIGAYQWLVDQLGLAIPEAIANKLIAIKATKTKSAGDTVSAEIVGSLGPQRAA
jgi:hypothetical protein